MADEFLRVVSVSGGKDSTALYLWAIEKFGKDGFRAVFADTDHEHPVTLNYVRNLHVMAGGPVVEWVKADFADRLAKKERASGGNGFLDMMIWKGRAPSSRAQFCTEHMKLEPIRRWLLENRGEKPVILYTGIRAGESAKRAKYKSVEWLEYYDAMTERPLLEWSEKQVFEYLEICGVEPNPLYDAGFTRVGCFPCIHSRKSELARLPDWAWKKLEDWEGRVGSSWFAYGTIPLTAEQATDLARVEARFPRKWETQINENGESIEVDLNRQEREIAVTAWKGANSPSVDQVRQWAKTSRGGSQFDFFAEDEKDVPACMSTWGACE